MQKVLATICYLATLATLTIASGCAGVSSSEGSLPIPTGQYNALQFQLTTDKQVYSLGETVNATFKVTNTGNSTVYYRVYPAFGLLVEQNASEVWDAYNHRLGDGGIAVTPIALDAGQSLSYSYSWSQVSDGNQWTGSGGNLPSVSPGKYTLRGYSYQDFYGYSNENIDWYRTNFAAPLVTITIQ